MKRNQTIAVIDQNNYCRLETIPSDWQCPTFIQDQETCELLLKHYLYLETSNLEGEDIQKFLRLAMSYIKQGFISTDLTVTMGNLQFTN